jgi:hypothetical protein
LHGDEEIAIQVAGLIDFHHPWIEPAQFPLNGRAAPFGFITRRECVSPPARTNFSAALRFSTVSMARYTSVMLRPIWRTIR